MAIKTLNKVISLRDFAKACKAESVSGYTSGDVLLSYPHQSIKLDKKELEAALKIACNIPPVTNCSFNFIEQAVLDDSYWSISYDEIIKLSDLNITPKG